MQNNTQKSEINLIKINSNQNQRKINEIKARNEQESLIKPKAGSSKRSIKFSASHLAN